VNKHDGGHTPACSPPHHCCTTPPLLRLREVTHCCTRNSSRLTIFKHSFAPNLLRHSEQFMTNASIKHTCFVPLLTSADCSCQQIHDGVWRAWSSGHSRISHRRRHHCVQRLPKLGEGGLCGPAMHDQGHACCCTTTCAHRRRCPSRWPLTLARIASLNPDGCREARHDSMPISPFSCSSSSS
jgi:hypothetical protein